MLASRLSDFDYTLPPELIAQAPLARRDESRLMVVDRAARTIAHRTFADLPGLMRAGDILVRNTTRVFRARLLGTRDSGAPAEVFLLRPLGDGRWEAMVHPGGKLHPGRVVSRTELLEKVWDLHFDPKTNVLDVHVARLRAKLRKEATGTELRTVRGKGFLFEAKA